ncbi:MAG: maltose ABC transporter substrate-binding protein [Protaetiibacter sp.]
MFTTRRGALAVGALLAGAPLLLSGCAAGSETTEDATSEIVVWADAERIEGLTAVAKEFEEEKGVTVKLVLKDFTTVFDDFTTQVPTGNGPDILVTPHNTIGAMVTNGVIAPIELGTKASEFEDVAVQAFTYEGKVYGLPYAIENIALLRNTELSPTLPATFDEAIEIGQASVASGASTMPLAVGLDPVAGDPYHLYPLQTSLGAPVFGLDADGGFDPDNLTLDNEGGQEFAKKLAEWGATGVLNPDVTGDIALETFLAGKTPFFLTGPWNLPAIRDAGIPYSIDIIPTTGSEVASPFAGVNGFVISSKSKNPVAANDFVVNFLSQESVQTELYEIGGRPPALTAALEKAADDPDVQAFGAVGATAVPMPAIPAMGSVWEDWGKTEMAIIRGEGDPVELWLAMAEKIRDKIAAS